jgi:hypothetical protein
VNVVPSRLAADVLARALCEERSDEDAAHGRLSIPDADFSTVRALLPLTQDVQVVEWADDEPPFTPYRHYVGRLPCGLTLVIQTDPVRVPMVELPDGGLS